jgi:hypothetical protein
MDIEQRVKNIEERNAKVEIDKDWEKSWTRRSVLALLTYLSISLYMNAIDIEKPWQNAIVPTVGFMISTLTMPFFQRMWLKYRK